MCTAVYTGRIIMFLIDLVIMSGNELVLAGEIPIAPFAVMSVIMVACCICDDGVVALDALSHADRSAEDSDKCECCCEDAFDELLFHDTKFLSAQC